MENKECMITLDEIISSVLTGGEAGVEAPVFVRTCEKNVAKELLNCTDKIVRKSTGGKEVGEAEKESWLEDEAAGLMDAVFEANRVYLKMGIKLGAGLVLQLLGL